MVLNCSASPVSTYSYFFCPPAISVAFLFQLSLFCINFNRPHLLNVLIVCKMAEFIYDLFCMLVSVVSCE